jgi:hypothetical protein
MSEYKFFYDVKYFPIPTGYEKTYRTTTQSPVKADIKNTIAPGIFEIGDQHLFYASNADKFNVLVYRFKINDVRVQVVKYKKTQSSTYSLCVKTTGILENVSVINVDFNTDILKPITFDINEYCKLISPVFLVKKDGTTVDLIAQNGNIYMCFANYGISLGKLKNNEVKFFAKGELMADSTIYIFDAFIADEVLEFPYNIRMEKCKKFIESIEWNNKTVKVIMSTFHNTFTDAYKESQTMPNDGVIIQPMKGGPLKWKPAKQNTVDVLVEDDLYLSKGFDGVISMKVIPNRDFDRRIIGEYRTKYEGEIIEIDMNGHFHRIRHDKFKPNAINTYKAGLVTTAVISPDMIGGTNEKLIPYLFDSYKNSLMEKYVHGKVVELGVDCPSIRKIQDMIVEDNFITLVDGASHECKINNSIRQTAKTFLQNIEKLDTIIIPNLVIAKDFGSEKSLIEACQKSLTNCGKIIVIANKEQFKILSGCAGILHSFELKNAPNISFVNSSLHKALDNYNILVISASIKEKPEFIFVVGLMGSGKSRFIHQIRNFIHPPTELNIINTDDLVAGYISYQLNSNEDNYKKIRSALDPQNDALINSLVKEKKSIVLETTRIDKDYADSFKDTHRIIGIICNTTIDQLRSNIERRNVFNIRKTAFNSGQYREFQTNKTLYKDRVDDLYEFDMNSSRFVRLNPKTGGYQSLPNNTPYTNKTYLTIDDLIKEEKYDYDVQAENISWHYGQRKLLISEIMFLALVARPDVKYHVVYAGSAPNIKFPTLYELFPNCKFILVDPNPFHKWENIDSIHLDTNQDLSNIIDSSNKRVFLINDLMTIDVSEKLKPLTNILYISDIRTNLINTAPLDLDTLFNNIQNKIYIDILKPLKYMLKFRTYFGIDKPDEEKKFMEIASNIPEWKMYQDRISELKSKINQGKIYLQCWPGGKSTEVRIIGDKGGFIDYNNEEAENKLFYYNVYLRKHPSSLSLTAADIFGKLSKLISAENALQYCGCNDCRIEAHWICKYVEVYKADINHVINLVNKHSQKIANHKKSFVEINHNFKNNKSKEKILQKY